MQARKLIVVADDYGIGPEVSRGILDLLRAGVVTSTVLLVNSPYAEGDIRLWSQAGRPGEMGWHPNLNLDFPVAPANEVSSLLDREGKLASLSRMMLRLGSGRLRYRDVVAEFDAQLARFHDLVGPPAMLNGHKHVHVFPMIRQALTDVLNRWRLRPYVRRVVEPRHCLRTVRGAWLKRRFLSYLGAGAAHVHDRAGFPGNEWLAGVTDPRWVADPTFFSNWLEQMPGEVVELAVHPGHYDESLIGRDCSRDDGQLERRVAELRLLICPDFAKACVKAGFTLCRAADLHSLHGRREATYAAA